MNSRELDELMIVARVVRNHTEDEVYAIFSGMGIDLLGISQQHALKLMDRCEQVGPEKAKLAFFDKETAIDDEWDSIQENAASRAKIELLGHWHDALKDGYSLEILLADVDDVCQNLVEWRKSLEPLIPIFLDTLKEEP